MNDDLTRRLSAIYQMRANALDHRPLDSRKGDRLMPRKTLGTAPIHVASDLQPFVGAELDPVSERVVGHFWLQLEGERGSLVRIAIEVEGHEPTSGELEAAAHALVISAVRRRQAT